MDITTLARQYGFVAGNAEENLPQWISNKIASGYTVGEWINNSFFVHYDDKRDASRLKRWKAIMVEGASSFKIPELNTEARVFEYFSNGEIDFLVCQTAVFAYPEVARATLVEIEKVVRALNELTEKNQIASGSPLPFPSQLAAQAKGDSFVENLFGKLLTYHGKYSDAGEIFRQSIERMPEFGEPYSNLGTLLWKLGKQREAFVLFAESVLKNPRGVTGQLNFFDAGYELQEFSAMTRIIEEIIKNNPDCIEYFHHLAICYARTSRELEAIQVINTILDKFPDDEEAKLLLQGIQSRSGQQADTGLN